jgi:hypothetical protein
VVLKIQPACGRLRVKKSLVKHTPDFTMRHGTESRLTHDRQLFRRPVFTTKPPASGLNLKNHEVHEER